jgi:hypothetical protein
MVAARAETAPVVAAMVLATGTATRVTPATAVATTTGPVLAPEMEVRTTAVGKAPITEAAAPAMVAARAETAMAAANVA